MRIGQTAPNNCFVDLVKDEAPPQLSLGLEITVNSYGFCGHRSSVWISQEIRSVFLADLQRLEKQRSGSASLVINAPDDFWLTISIQDRLGNLAIEGSLTRIVFAGKQYQNQVTFGFDLSGEYLGSILSDFEELFAI
jgi:hypothetical protein